MKKKFIYMTTSINDKETYLGYVGEQNWWIYFRKCI